MGKARASAAASSFSRPSIRPRFDDVLWPAPPIKRGMDVAEGLPGPPPASSGQREEQGFPNKHWTVPDDREGLAGMRVLWSRLVTLSG